ncbi:MAG: hemerythrin domain-containing protein [Sideroxydans sp.]|nr:hemerythrin domain-containing protein [Sideroxydans sp.]
MNTSQVKWDDARHTLGMNEMDTTHREFIAQVVALISASDAQFPALFQTLAEHTRAHFEAEGKLMRDSHYKGFSEHDSEHQRVLGELKLLSRTVQRGQFASVREYVQEGLPKWFDTHLAMMDSALVMHLKNPLRQAQGERT